MPQAADQEDGQDVEIGSGGSLPAPSQGDVEALPEEGGQGDVPAFPELPDGQAPVRGIEVYRQPEAQETGAAGGDVAVAGEVEVQLQGVAQNHQPGGGGGEFVQTGPAVAGDNPQIVRQQHFFRHAGGDGVQGGGEVLSVGPEELLPPELGEKRLGL